MLKVRGVIYLLLDGPAEFERKGGEGDAEGGRRESRGHG